jgi:hypothetical protein
METQKDVNNYFFEQYKLYLHDINEIGNRQSQTRSFYVSIISALLVFASFVGKSEIPLKMHIMGQSSVAVLGILLCIAWYIHSLSFNKLFLVKFSIIKEIEEELPIQLFAKEDVKFKTHHRMLFSKIESIISLIITLPFIMLLCSIIF